MLAKIPRETTKTKDITGGLPRVVELFEARRPRDPAVMSEVDGIVKHGPVVKGQRKIFVVPDDAEQREYSIPRGVHVNVQEGERVRPGEPLMDGPRDPHDILKVLGARELQKYLVNEIQEVYRLQGVAINDKHIEVIVRQMLRWVKVEDVGDTEFLIDEQVDKFRFDEENERVITEGGRPATGRPLLLGITKASLSTDSFISAASFQETTRVLTEASISGKVDYLRGLKENVTMGRLIPAGTGFEYYRHVTIPPDEPPPPPPPAQPTRRRARARSRDGVLRRARGSDRVARGRAGGIAVEGHPVGPASTMKGGPTGSALFLFRGHALNDGAGSRDALLRAVLQVDIASFAPGIVLPGWWVRDFYVAGRAHWHPRRLPGARRDRSVPRVGNAVRPTSASSRSPSAGRGGAG